MMSSITPAQSAAHWKGTSTVPSTVVLASFFESHFLSATSLGNVPACLLGAPLFSTSARSASFKTGSATTASFETFLHYLFDVPLHHDAKLA